MRRRGTRISLHTPAAFLFFAAPISREQERGAARASQFSFSSRKEGKVLYGYEDEEERAQEEGEGAGRGFSVFIP
jgi:hypothetical protein